MPSVLEQEEMPLTELMKLPGKLLGKRSNTYRVGPLKLASYRIEEFSLPRAMKVEFRGQKVEVEKAWRLTLAEGPSRFARHRL